MKPKLTFQKFLKRFSNLPLEKRSWHIQFKKGGIPWDITLHDLYVLMDQAEIERRKAVVELGELLKIAESITDEKINN